MDACLPALTGAYKDFILFCNNFKKQIQGGKKGNFTRALPKIKIGAESEQDEPVILGFIVNIQNSLKARGHTPKSNS